MQFNKTQFEAFRKDVKAALAAVEAEYGVSIETGKITYQENKFKMSFEVTNGAAEEVEKQEFIRLARRFGFRPDQYLNTFDAEGKTFELFGFNEGSPKNSCKIRDVVTGRAYKCSPRFLEKNGF